MTWNKNDAEVIRSLIKHESNVVNQRITWLTTLNGLLFVALRIDWHGELNKLLPIVLFLGVAISFSSMVSLFCADVASKNLVKEWDKNKPEDYDGPDIIGYRPLSIWVRFLMPWISLPVLLIVGWIWVIIELFKTS